MSFSERLRSLRIEKGLSQQRLAEKAGLSQTAIYQLEKGIRNPKLETVRKIATALGVTISELQPDWGQFSKEEIIKDFSFCGKQASEELQETIAQRNAGYTAKINNAMDLLNDKGQDKAIEQVEMLTKIPEYQKEKK